MSQRSALAHDVVEKPSVPVGLPSPSGTPTSQAPLPSGLLVDAIDEYAIFRLDPEGQVRSWNLGAQRIKGYTETEILGVHMSVFYDPEDRAAGVPQHHLDHAVSHGQWCGEGWRVRRDGTRFWANVVLTAVFGLDGRLDGFVKITRDESDRRAAQGAHEQIAVMLERERIGLGLSDTTVRSIFSATLALDGALGVSRDPCVTAQIRQALLFLEASLRQVRDTVTDRDPARQDDSAATNHVDEGPFA